MSKVILISAIAVYLYYMNMQKNTIDSPEHIKADITQEKPKIKEHVPIIADEKPKPAKPIAIPNVEASQLATNFQYHPIHGWINYDLMHKLHTYTPKFKTFQSKNYI